MVIGFLVTSLTKALLALLLSLAGWPTLASPVGSTRLPLHNDGNHSVPRDIHSFINGFIPLPRSLSRHNLIVEVYKEFLGLHGLGIGLKNTEGQRGILINKICHRWTKSNSRVVSQIIYSAIGNGLNTCKWNSVQNNKMCQK